MEFVLAALVGLFIAWACEQVTGWRYDPKPKHEKALMTIDRIHDNAELELEIESEVQKRMAEKLARIVDRIG